MSQVRSLPDKNSDNDIDRNYFIIYVGENHSDHIVNWKYFAVSKDLDDVMCMDIVNGKYISLEEWRVSQFYPDYLTEYMHKDISSTGYFYDEVLFAAEKIKVSIDNNKILKDYFPNSKRRGIFDLSIWH